MGSRTFNPFVTRNSKRCRCTMPSLGYFFSFKPTVLLLLVDRTHLSGTQQADGIIGMICQCFIAYESQGIS